MTQQRTVTPVCPYLGLPDDAQSHFSFPEGGHTCRAREKPWRIELGYQASYCLSDNYGQCGRYRTATRPRPTLSRGLIPLSPDEEGRPAPRAKSGKGLNSVSRVLVALLAVWLLGTLAIVVVLSFTPPGAPTPSPTNDVAHGSPTPALPTAVPALPTAVPATPTALPTAVPTASPQPTQLPTPTGSPPPTASPLPSPSPLIHVVQKTETLWDIGKLYGVYWTIIADANGITDPNLIHQGQELIIPAPGSTLRPTQTP